MVNVEISWRDRIFIPDRIVLATDLDERIIEIVQQWVVLHLNELQPPFSLERMLTLAASLIQHLARSGTLQGVYVGKDFQEGSAESKIFRTTYPLETMYVDLDSDYGASFAIGSLSHFGPRTTESGFLNYDPDGFRKKMKKTKQEVKIAPFEDVLDILED